MGPVGARGFSKYIEAPLGAGTFLGTYRRPGPRADSSAALQSGLLGRWHSHPKPHRQAASTGQPCDVFLASSRYGCIFPYSEEDGGPLDQLKM